MGVLEGEASDMCTWEPRARDDLSPEEKGSGHRVRQEGDTDPGGNVPLSQ